MTKMIKQKQHYVTIDLKLSALLLAEIPDCTFEITSQGNSVKKNIKLIFPEQVRVVLDSIICDYINRQARVDVSKYNRNLNLLRDALRVH